jgi:hypothetical protein
VHISVSVCVCVCIHVCVCKRGGEERVCTLVETCMFMHQQHFLTMFLVYDNAVYLSYINTEHLLKFMHHRFITVRYIAAVPF